MHSAVVKSAAVWAPAGAGDPLTDWCIFGNLLREGMSTTAKETSGICFI
jgi:hypothetical protein